MSGKITKEEKYLANFKNALTKSLLSLEILKVKELPENEEEAEKLYNEHVKTKTYIIDDLSNPYLIRLSYSDSKSKLKSVDPDFIDDADRFELTESIQDILRENGFPVNKSNFPEKEEDANGN